MKASQLPSFYPADYTVTLFLDAFRSLFSSILAFLKTCPGLNFKSSFAVEYLHCITKMGRKNNKKKQNSTQDLDQVFDTELLTCERSPVLGRYLKAKADIKKGTIILKEQCLIAGPKISSGAACIGCHSTTKLPEPARFSCSKCGWNICSPKCQKSRYHVMECKLFRDKGIKPPANIRSAEYGALPILRALLLKTNRPEDWKKLSTLEHHNEERKGTPTWEEDEYIIKVIREFWGFTSFTEEEIHLVSGIYEVNGFEMGAMGNYGGIFLSAAMIAHDCVPNAGHFVNMDDETLEVVAVLDIPAGTPVTMCYDCCLKSTSIRRQQLWNSKYFLCTCNRCKDPTELGSQIGSLLCTNPSCKHGLVSSVVEENSSSVVWKCSRCMKTRPTSEVDRILKQYDDIAENQLHTLRMKEQFLEECKTIFHPNHYIPISVKFSLCMAYGHEEGYTLFDLTPTLVHRKYDLCQEVLKVLDILTPGYSTTRGNILYEIQAAEVLIARNLMEGGKVSKGLIRRRLQNTLKVLNEAIEIFELSYPMRMLAESANTTTLTEVHGFIKALK